MATNIASAALWQHFANGLDYLSELHLTHTDVEHCEVDHKLFYVEPGGQLMAMKVLQHVQAAPLVMTLELATIADDCEVARHVWSRLSCEDLRVPCVLLQSLTDPTTT